MAFPRVASTLAGILLLGAALPACSQPNRSPTNASFSLGWRAGFSSYTIDGQEVDLHTRIGTDELHRVPWFTLGAVARQRLYRPLSLQLEANYLREGGRFAGNYFTGRTDYIIDCLQLPLLLDLQIPGTEHLSLHLQGGLAFTLLANGVSLDMPSFAPQNRFSNPSSFFAAAYGGELAWRQGRRTYFFNARYSQDLTDYYQREYYSTHYNARSSGFTLAVGMLLSQPFAPLTQPAQN